MHATRISAAIAATAADLCLFAWSVAQADEVTVYRAAIVERGIYQAISEERLIGQSDIGPVIKVRDASLVQSTTTILARPSVRFGARYVITGAPLGARVDITIVTRFPKAGLHDPSTGLRHNQSAYTIEATVGALAYREFKFVHPWEIVAGEWTFEFWHQGKLLGSQKFCVLDIPLEGSDRPLPAECAMVVGRLKSPSRRG